jgi:EAL domain-containing protein (putative c-di-GMP-specific phosphodiesterase class I)
MITLCRELGYAPLVEGVETAAQDTFLRDSRSRYAQGYFYGHPMPLDELLTLARSFPSHKIS